MRKSSFILPLIFALVFSGVTNVRVCRAQCPMMRAMASGSSHPGCEGMAKTQFAARAVTPASKCCCFKAQPRTPFQSEGWSLSSSGVSIEQFVTLAVQSFTPRAPTSLFALTTAPPGLAKRSGILLAFKQSFLI